MFFKSCFILHLGRFSNPSRVIGSVRELEEIRPSPYCISSENLPTWLLAFYLGLFLVIILFTWINLHPVTLIILMAVSQNPMVSVRQGGLLRGQNTEKPPTPSGVLHGETELLGRRQSLPQEKAVMT